MVRVTAIGCKAHAALRAAASPARVLSALSESIYLTAGDEIVWLGRVGALLHPRAILTASPLPGPDEPLRFDLDGTRPWKPSRLNLGGPGVHALAGGCRALLGAIESVGAPDGLGTLLVGRIPPFPLDRAPERAAALARACGADDARAAAEAARALLGLGPGLTPSGDDYVGGALFARAVLGGAGACDGAGWRRAAAAVLGRAREATHPISAALLGDLADGEGHAPLHELTTALASEAPLEAAVEAARRLTRIGHSSGWDMLAGFTAGILGEVAVQYG
ncbi:MAG: DUF2877 domain-containing protein [Candidatus Rokubacteria bacterium]|nr:DUF2877 domain-containing protein [Candidatus Rokubacteria bacterium]